MRKVKTAMPQDQLLHLLSFKLRLFLQVLYRLLLIHRPSTTHTPSSTYRLRLTCTLLHNLVPHISLKNPPFLLLHRNKQTQSLLLSNEKQKQIQQLLRLIYFAKMRKATPNLLPSNLQQSLLLPSKIKQTKKNPQMRFLPLYFWWPADISDFQRLRLPGFLLINFAPKTSTSFGL